jgi:hypothetical protein
MWARKGATFQFLGWRLWIGVKSTYRGFVQCDYYSDCMTGRGETDIANAFDVLVYSKVNLVNRSFKSKTDAQSGPLQKKNLPLCAE